MRRRSAYFLCATPRSGTTLLCDLLSDTRQAGRPQSYYRRQDIEKLADAWGIGPRNFPSALGFEQAYLEAVRQEGAGDTGVFGMRVMWGTLGEMAERLSPLRPGLAGAALFESLFGPLVYVHVSRTDKVAQAISLLKAEQGGLWHVVADGSDRQRTVPSTSVHYDGHRIAELLSDLERDDAAWNGFFSEHGIEPLRMKYEAMVADPGAEARKILLALGRSPERADEIVVRTRRMANHESDAWAKRFRRDRSGGA
jgi:LPS sulfotransferase NodH